MNTKVVIVDSVRTAIGSFNGALANLSAVDLGACVIKALLKRNEIAKESVSEVIMGQVLTAAVGQNPARQSSIKAGLPHSVPSMTINKVCGSGLKAVHLAAQSIQCGQGDIIIAGGQESMSNAAHVLPNSRKGVRMGGWEMLDSMIVDGLWDAFNDYHMGQTAENIAQKYGFSREQQDEFAANSQQKAYLAQRQGKFEEEIISVMIPQRKTDAIEFKIDEYPRHNTTMQTLAKLRPAFTKQGTVTAGNASGLNDGASAHLVMSETMANKLGLTPMAKIVAYSNAGVDPAIMGTGPIPASKKCLQKAGWEVSDLDLIEANEAFAAQAMAVNQDMAWPVDKVNVNGGAIALGHPIGASGARILTTLLYEMKRSDVSKGLATLCIGGGLGVALAVER